VGIQDRDYMREKRLRWDERSGEMRLDDSSARQPKSRWPAVAIAVACAAVVAVAGWMWWRSQSAVVPGSASERGVESSAGVSIEQGWTPESPVLEGQVTRVTDGDSLKVQLTSGPIEVRMHAIDAPERDQPGGAESKAALIRRLDGQAVALEPVEQDQYGRMVAVVYAGDVNVNAWLVRQGHAWVYRQYAEDPRYCEAEMAARGEQRGVWALYPNDQKAPWEWRAVSRGRRTGYTDYSGESLERCVAALGKRPQQVGESTSSGGRESPEGPSQGRDSRERASRGETHRVERRLRDESAGPQRSLERSVAGSTACPGGDCRLAGEASAPQTLLAPPSTTDAKHQGCRIKGNISGSGKIYHVPGSDAYEKTKIDESKGERWFCSEDQARAAGWRAPRG
jgi:endonuclease YncB( thermonuclease family)